MILYSTDLKLNWKNLIDYYRRKFQIEFNSRDAKQYRGLEGFMVIKEQSIIVLKARQQAVHYAQALFKYCLKTLNQIMKPI